MTNKIIDNLLVCKNLQNLLDQMPGCWGCKDTSSVFTYANKEYARVIGIGENNHLDVIGKTDFDMPGETVKCAELFRKQDKTVMTSKKKLRILNVHPVANKEWKVFLSTKAPLYNNEKIVAGVIVHAIDITHSTTLELGSLLAKIAVSTPGELIEGQNSFLLSHKFNHIKLSDREAECLFFILRGKTAKLIARYLGISSRTVEVYFNDLKIKFNVQNKHGLIDKAIQGGFLNIIPESLFRRQLSVVLNED
jgi:DNA-binding CsgD family transcriptional regulator